MKFDLNYGQNSFQKRKQPPLLSVRKQCKTNSLSLCPQRNQSLKTQRLSSITDAALYELLIQNLEKNH